MANRITVKRCAVAVSVLILLYTLSAFAGSSPTWLKLNPPNSPSGRAAFAMAYDPASKNVVVFGGFDFNGYKNETWLFDGTTWTQANPANAPSARAAASISYDQPSGKLILFGGYDGSNYLGDTWIWDGLAQSWTQATPATQPTAVSLPMSFSDPVNGRAEMFGGFDGNFFQEITWQWTGSDWLQLNPKNFPSARGASVVANDYAHKTVLIFAGLGDVNPNNTWTWDGTNWTQQNPSTQPPSTYYAAAAFDPDLKEVVATGGGLGQSTWAWTGSDWVTVTTAQTPSARWSQWLAYDTQSKQLLMFGGQNAGSMSNVTYQLIAPRATAAKP